MQILMKVHVINFWLPFISADIVHIFRTHKIFGGQSICARMNFHNLIIWSSMVALSTVIYMKPYVCSLCFILLP